MAGHSKWKNIRRRKEATDAARAAIFSKLAKELTVAVKHGGPDPETNFRLKDVIAKAKGNNMPNDNIMRTIQKASFADADSHFEDIVYEGYGPGGVAVLVRTLTDNRNRTAGDIRHLFDKYGGKLGVNGSVAFMFSTRGMLILDAEKHPDEEQVLTDALEAGAQDVISEEDYYEIQTDEQDYYAVKDALEKSQYTFLSSELGLIPQTQVRLTDEQADKMRALLDKMEENEDIQDVYHNWDE